MSFPRGHLARLAGAEHSIYQCLDADGAPLYIGCSVTPAARLMCHRSKPWWPSIAEIRIEQVTGRDAAMRRERELIEQHQPPHNLLHTERAPFDTAADYARALAAGWTPTEQAS